MAKKSAGTKRRLGDWIAAYIEYTKHTEPPLSYHTWVAISTLAGALQRRVYMNWGHETIYPNQFIVLIGPSGMSRKGAAVGIGKDLAGAVKIQMTANRVTREALYKFMKDSTTAYTDKTNGRYKFQSAVTCISPELHVFLGTKNVDFLAELTDMYDSADEWRYETKHFGKDVITGVCLNLLGATAPDWLPSILPAEAVGGGFTSRVIFVVEDQKGQTVADPNKYKADLKLRESLVYDLEQIMLMAGEMIFDDRAHQAYIDWYEASEVRLRNGTQDLIDPRLGGYNSRRATHLKKLSMAISASRSNDLIITHEDISRAMTILQATEKKMPRVFTGLGKARFAEATEELLYLIAKEGRVSRSSILRRFYTKIDTFVLDSVEQVLEGMKAIRIERTKGLGDKIYIYIGGDDHGA